ncbi:gliding motility-associated peptidyl-prolyl isomerase GldI [Maribacter algarum]|uniref:peptidylprolyl isomerase n=1 Tax=Maribacter algarum (ex Zhang et al. 2020) TaxID=2578118 RepID=A0A5S3PN54_9FLAO|nr:gliding motility-associated peptidyl-prolyl isomerase GldI [Maribacter algarum]TMM53866.1 gliding motility-associated peptidyl-prolyl isomerase GldI [Maribacter algarum]
MRNLVCLLLFVGLISCEGPVPRHPVKRKTGSSIEASIERSKKLLALEESIMKQVIAKDSTNSYLQSDTGSWYYYNKKNEVAIYTPQPDDLVTLTYNILSLSNDTIYKMEDIGILKYKVDKQELFPGLRNSVKLLKENETATFLFPSSLGYGYPGDGDKIGINMPLKSTIAILKIEKDSI